MIRGLIEKELRQHGYMLAFLGVILVAGLVLISGHGPLRRSGGGGFMVVLLLHYTFVPLGCVMLGQALIASEFRQKTQLFLEGLPLPRWRMLAVKFTLGLITLLGAVGIAIGLAWWKARHTEAMTPRFAGLLALKSAGWIWFCYSFCFAHAFLGRYRIIFGVAVLVGWIAAANSGVEMSAFGPFALIDPRFPYERLIIPREALIVTALLGGGLAAMGFSLGLVRDATVASLLAEKMSAREKVFMTMLVFTGLVIAGGVMERRKATAPVQIPGTIEARVGTVQVLTSAAVDAPTTAETQVLNETAQRVASELNALAQFLGCTSFPRVFIVHRRDLEADEFLNGDLKPNQGVLVRANLTDEDFVPSALEEWLVRETLLAHSGGLAARERNAWVLDGIAWWWIHSDHGTADALDADAQTSTREMMPADFASSHLRAWFSLRAKIGEEKARQLAGTGLAIVARRQGFEANQRFLSAMFSRDLPPDLRGWLRDVLRSTPARLQNTTGWTESDLTREWRAILQKQEGTAP